MATRRPPVISKRGLRRPSPLVVAANLLATTLATVVAAAQPHHQTHWPAPRYSRPPRLEQPKNILTTTLATVSVAAQPPHHQTNWPSPRYSRLWRPEQPANLLATTLAEVVIGPIEPPVAGEFRKRRVKLRRQAPKRPIVIEEAPLPAEFVGPLPEADLGPSVDLDYDLKVANSPASKPVDLSVPIPDRPLTGIPARATATARKKRDASSEDVMMILKVLKDLEEL